MAAIHIQGYSDQISLQPGDRINFMVSVQGTSSYHADIVRLINGDSNPAGPGPKEEVITTTVSGEYRGRVQPICSGSYIVVNDRDGLLNLGAAISIHAFIMPTTPAKGAQAIISRWDPERRAGWALVVDDQQRLALWIGDGGGGGPYRGSGACAADSGCLVLCRGELRSCDGPRGRPSDAGGQFR